MIILSKPEFFRKNESNLMKISRDALKAIPSVSGHSYFRKTKNWKHIVFNFFSIPENQIEVVLFDGTLTEPEGELRVSPRARNEFRIESVVLHDFDNGWLDIPREDLDISEFDFIFDSRFWQPDLSVVLQNKSNAILNWTEADETGPATEYVIYRKVGSGEFDVLTTVIGDRTYTDTGLQPETTYTYKVEISDFQKYLPANEEEAVTPTRPNTPTNLVTSTTPGQVSLSWNAVTPIAGQPVTYRVYRSQTINDQNPTMISSGLNNPNYTDNTVTNGTLYYYKIKSYDGFESLFSNEVGVRPLGQFSITSFAATSASEASISWGASAGASSYKVFYKKLSDSTWIEISGATSPRSISGLSEGETYEAYVQASNTYSNYSTASSQATIPYTPSVPTGLTASSWQDGVVNLSWSPATYADKYFVYRSLSQNGTYTKISEPTSTSYSDTGVTNGTTYWYKISSVNVEGTLNVESNKSSEASGLPNAPSTEIYVGTNEYTSTNVDTDFQSTTNVPASLVSQMAITLYNSSGNQIQNWTSGSNVDSFGTPSASLTRSTPYSVVSRVTLTDGRVVSKIMFFKSMARPATNLVATNSANPISISWTASSGSGSYRVNRSTQPDMTSMTILGVVTGTSFTDNGASNDVTYYYSVNAYPTAWSGTAPTGFTYQGSYVALMSEMSNIDDGIRSIPIPTPRIDEIQTLAAKEVTITWGGVISGYQLRVYRSPPNINTSTSQNNTNILIATINNPAPTGTYTDTDPAKGNGALYHYKLVYTDTNSKVSPDSTVRGRQVLGDWKAGSMTKSGATSNSVTLTWPAVEGATYYIIDYGPSGSPTMFSNAQTANGSENTVSRTLYGPANSNPSTNYSFTVTAYSAAEYPLNSFNPTNRVKSIPVGS